MVTFSFRLPETTHLVKGLNCILHETGVTSGAVAVIDRQPNAYSSTFPSEVVTCRREDGRQLRLLCKYMISHIRHIYGHRSGVPYEIDIYRHLLSRLEVSTPTFYGDYADPTSGERWLVLEYLSDSLPAGFVEKADAMSLAARWAGEFHAACQSLLKKIPPPYLIQYDAEYYRGWASRTQEFAGCWHSRLPWLPEVIENFMDFADELATFDTTVIHGEFYSQNVLFSGGNIYPVDWESAAVAFGEIDLAALTDRWPSENIRQCVQAYQGARWPAGAPAAFGRRLTAARVYLHFRWLGNKPEWTAQEKCLRRFEELRADAEELRLI